jgi:hypothetical protein
MTWSAAIEPSNQALKWSAPTIMFRIYDSVNSKWNFQAGSWLVVIPYSARAGAQLSNLHHFEVVLKEKCSSILLLTSPWCRKY